MLLLLKVEEGTSNYEDYYYTDHHYYYEHNNRILLVVDDTHDDHHDNEHDVILRILRIQLLLQLPNSFKFINNSISVIVVYSTYLPCGYGISSYEPLISRDDDDDGCGEVLGRKEECLVVVGEGLLVGKELDLGYELVVGIRDDDDTVGDNDDDGGGTTTVGVGDGAAESSSAATAPTTIRRSASCSCSIIIVVVGSSRLFVE